MVSFPRACLAVARVAPGAFEDEDDASTVHTRYGLRGPEGSRLSRGVWLVSTGVL
jgi:hypothetical protein